MVLDKLKPHEVTPGCVYLYASVHSNKVYVCRVESRATDNTKVSQAKLVIYPGNHRPVVRYCRGHSKSFFIPVTLQTLVNLGEHMIAKQLTEEGVPF